VHIVLLNIYMVSPSISEHGSNRASSMDIVSQQIVFDIIIYQRFKQKHLLSPLSYFL